MEQANAELGVLVPTFFQNIRDTPVRPEWRSSRATFVIFWDSSRSTFPATTGSVAVMKSGSKRKGARSAACTVERPGGAGTAKCDGSIVPPRRMVFVAHSG